MDAPNVSQWLYHHRANACLATVIGGEERAGWLQPWVPAARRSSA
jgi:hypothetical protein